VSLLKNGSVGPRTSALWAIVGFLIPLLFAARNLSTWPARLAYGGEESYEGVPLAEMVRLGHGEPIYSAGAAYSFSDGTYGPVYYLTGAHVLNLQNPSYFPLRLLSAFGMLGCAAGCGLLAFWLSRSYVALFLAPPVFLSYGMVTDHGLQALSDGIALLLFFSGLLIAYRFREKRLVLLAVPLMVLGFFYKPQYVAGPVAVVLFLLSERRWRRAAEFVGLSALGGVCLFGYFQWVAFQGQAFWRHFLLYQASLFVLRRFGMALFIYALLFLIPLVFVIEFLRVSRDRMIACYVCAALVLGLVTYSKSASGVHYFFETALIVSALIPALIARELAHGRPFDLLLVLALMLFAGQWSTTPPPRPSDCVQHQAIQDYLRHNFAPADEALGPAPGDLAQAGLCTPYSGLFTLTRLVERARLSDRDLTTAIRAHRFAVIALYFDVWRERDPQYARIYVTAPMLQAIQEEYALAASLDLPLLERLRPESRLYIYVPRSAIDSLPAGTAR